MTAVRDAIFCNLLPFKTLFEHKLRKYSEFFDGEEDFLIKIAAAVEQAIIIYGLTEASIRLKHDRDVIPITMTVIPKKMSLRGQGYRSLVCLHIKGKKIGEGTFKTVYKMPIVFSETWSVTILAALTCNIRPCQGLSHYRNLFAAFRQSPNEVQQYLDIPYAIVPYTSTHSGVSQQKMCILSPLADGDLIYFLHKQESCFDLDACNKLAYQMMQAVAALHSLGFIHRDLKPENFLVYNSTNNGNVMVKLSDWDLVTKKDLQRWAHVGTISYLPGKIIKQWKTSSKFLICHGNRVRVQGRLVRLSNKYGYDTDIYALFLTLAVLYGFRNAGEVDRKKIRRVAKEPNHPLHRQALFLANTHWARYTKPYSAQILLDRFKREVLQLQPGTS